jgi:hypothetical protein
MKTQTQEALKMAIEAIKWLRMRSPIIYEEIEAEKACKEALAQSEQIKADFDVMAYGQSFMLDGKHIPVSEVHEQPAQEPFAWYKPEGSWHDGFMLHKDRGISELSDATYTIPLYKGEDNA